MKLYEMQKQAFEIPLEIGDVVLKGKFKNSPITVKKFGKDKNGQPTVNGYSLLAVRIKKLMPKDHKRKTIKSIKRKIKKLQEKLKSEIV